MSIIKQILREEYERLQKLEIIYSEDIKRLPKGSISYKKRHYKYYAYQVFRVGSKVKFFYLGKPSSEKVIKLSEKIEKRRISQKQLHQVRANLKEVRRALRE